MLRLLKLSPPHGWRAVLWELAIVTLGVLIALAAQQTVEDIQRRADQRALRETIDHEIALNLFAYHVRSRQFPCGEKRMAELTIWLDRARSGERVPALRPRGPATVLSLSQRLGQPRRRGVQRPAERPASEIFRVL